MKKTLFVILALLCSLTLTFSSCKKKQQTPDTMVAIEESVKSDKAKTPYQVNENSTLIDCYLSDKTITYKYDVKPEVFKTMDVDKQKENTINGLKTNLNSQEFCKNIKETACTLRYVYTNHKDSIVFTVAPTELN